jgi:hypothetical protein
MATARRGFLKSLAVAPLASAALAQKPLPAAAPPPAVAPAGPEAVAEALTEAVKRQYGAQFDADGLAVVRKQIEESLRSAARLRAASRLGNAEMPVNLFAARPPEAPGKGGRR